jgi:DNA-directed RNA polymerase specialized sigma24 family protein
LLVVGPFVRIGRAGDELDRNGEDDRREVCHLLLLIKAHVHLCSSHGPSCRVTSATKVVAIDYCDRTRAGTRRMNKDWELTGELLNRLLDWLDRDREAGARKYALIQLRLVRFFATRGCVDAENQADKCINVVTARLQDLGNYVGDPALYFWGVARYVYLEYLRELNRPPPPQPPPPEPELDPNIDKCLKRCLGELSEGDRLLVYDYEEGEKQVRIQKRRQIADDLGMSLNALRIRIYRLHQQLRQCMEQCLKELPAH